MSTSKKDPEAVRQKVLADPNTAVIAESLGIELEDYADQVVHYVMNPAQPAAMVTMSDADIASVGLTPVDGKALLKHLAESAAVLGDRSQFISAQRPKVALDQVRVGEGVDVAGVDPKLKADLAEELRRNRDKKG